MKFSTLLYRNPGFLLALLLAVSLLVACDEQEPAMIVSPDMGGNASLPDLPEDLDLWDEEDMEDTPDDLEHLGETLLGLPVLDIQLPQETLLELLQNPDRRDEVPVEASFEGRQYQGVTLELHGGFARTAPKLSFRVNFRDENLRVRFAGPLEAHKTVVLQASWIDPTFQRNRLTFDTVRAMGGLAPRVEYAVLAFNGRLYGLYLMIERIDRTYLTRQDLDGTGSLYKAENHNANWSWREDILEGYAVKNGKDRELRDLEDLLRRITTTTQTQEAYATHIEPILSLEDVMRWQAVHTFAQNQDTFTKNYYLYHDITSAPQSPEAQFRVISWDADATWGMNWNGEPLSSDQEHWHGSDRFAPKLFSIVNYRTRYLEILENAMETGGALHTQTLHEQVHETELRIGSMRELDLTLWPRGRASDE